jgi:KDO2-lipid IV(A) lauroyltransferase
MVAEAVLARYRINKKNWQDFVTIEASEEANAILHAEKQSAIVASGHLGNWDVAARAVSMVTPVNVIYRPFNNPYLERDMNAERGGEQLHLISKYKANPMRFMKILADGEKLALMIDQHISEVAERVRVSFFGRPCWSTRSVAMMAMTVRKPLLVACAIRTGRMKFKLIVTGPIKFERSGNRETDVLNITQSITDMIEAAATEYPEQYLWGHNRWQDE